MEQLEGMGETDIVSLEDMFHRVPALLTACALTAVKQLRLVSKQLGQLAATQIRGLVVSVEEPMFTEAMSKLPEFLNACSCQLQRLGMIVDLNSFGEGRKNIDKQHASHFHSVTRLVYIHLDILTYMHMIFRSYMKHML